VDDRVDLTWQVKVLGHILLDQSEPLVSKAVRDVLGPAGDQVVEDDDLVVSL
jgi:hypothetical protein